jgi:nudix-type nucleoside diphosphatase (YffH/AdpP family)
MARIEKVRTVHEGWSTFRLIDFRLDDDSLVERAVEDHGDAVVVLPYDPDRKVATLVRQLRPPVAFRRAEGFWEPPAGLLDMPGESPETCARREALEETGLRLPVLEPLGCYWSTPGSSTERAHLFLGAYAGVDRLGQGGGADAHEDIEVKEVALKDLAAALDRGELEDLKLMACLLSLMRRRPELFN